MARQKQIKYIQLDVNIREDSKIAKLCYYIDDDADVIFLEFVRAIFIEKSYYIQFDPDMFLFVARRRKKWTVEMIQTIFYKCIELDLFNKNLFEKYGILTSKSIQERFFQTGESSNWRNITIIKEYFLLENLEEFTNKKGNIYNVQTLNSTDTDSFKSDLKSENIPKNDFKSDLKPENATKSDFKSDLWALIEPNKKDLDKSKSNITTPQPPKSSQEHLSPATGMGGGGDFEKWFSNFPVDWAGINNRGAYKRRCQREWNALTPQEQQACAQFASTLSATAGLRSPLYHLQNKDFYDTPKVSRQSSVDRKSNPERAKQAMQKAYTKNDLERPFVIKNKIIEC